MQRVFSAVYKTAGAKFLVIVTEVPKFTRLILAMARLWKFPVIHSLLPAIVWLLCTIIPPSSVLGADDKALVTSLPGWNADLPSKHYSGYVDVSQGRMHYVFAKSENENCDHIAGRRNSDQDVPLVLWVQGGPGCSSLYG